MKTCRGCAIEKPFSDYYVNVRMKDGHLSWCKSCTIARYREGKSARQRRLVLWIQAVKVERGCVDCGYRAHAEALDFDHLPGFVKEHKMASLAAGSTLAKIEAEIAKCEVVCANCHRVRTARRRQPINGHSLLV